MDQPRICRCAKCTDEREAELRAKCEEMQTLLLRVRWVLEQKCWRTYGALATLRNDIDDLLDIEDLLGD